MRPRKLAGPPRAAGLVAVALVMSVGTIAAWANPAAAASRVNVDPGGGYCHAWVRAFGIQGTSIDSVQMDWGFAGAESVARTQTWHGTYAAGEPWDSTPNCTPQSGWSVQSAHWQQYKIGGTYYTCDSALVTGTQGYVTVFTDCDTQASQFGAMNWHHHAIWVSGTQINSGWSGTEVDVLSP